MSVCVCVCVTDLLDEVPGINGQVWGQTEFTLQDLINGLLSVFSCEWRLVENQRRKSVINKGVLNYWFLLSVNKDLNPSQL